jgi:hypothetical protein
MSDWQINRDYSGWKWGIADVAIERFFGPAEKINILCRSLGEADR